MHDRPISFSVRPFKSSGLPKRGVCWLPLALAGSFYLHSLGQELHPAPVAKQSSAGSSKAAAIAGRVDPRSVMDFRGLGGIVYSTGLAPVSVTMTRVRSGEGSHKGPGYPGQIYLVTKGRIICLGSNYDNKTLNLGWLPAGELRIVVNNPPESFTASTGPGARNAAALPHATVRDLPNGVVRVDMEMSPGLVEQRLIYGSGQQQAYARENFLADVHLYFTGGVTGDATVPLLIDSLKTGAPEVRLTAAGALRQAHPDIARGLGLFGRGQALPGALRAPPPR
jgi:hypothetical protein